MGSFTELLELLKKWYQGPENNTAKNVEVAPLSPVPVMVVPSVTAIPKIETVPPIEAALPIGEVPTIIKEEVILDKKPEIVATAFACQRYGITQKRSGISDLSLVLKSWCDMKGNAVQFDGSIKYENNPGPWVYFDFKGKTYKLAGDTKDFAVKRFLDLVEKAEDPDSVLIVATGRAGNPVLRLLGQSKAEGWYCTQA